MKKDNLSYFFIEVAPVPVLLLQKKNIVYANKHTCELFGYSEDKMLKSKISDLQSDKVKSKEEIYFLNWDNHGFPDNFETIGVKSNGEEFPIEIFNSNIKLEDEYFSMVVLIDISERIKNADRAKKGENIFFTLVENSPNDVVLTSNEGVIQFINRTDPPEMASKIIGKNIVDIFDDNNSELIRKSIAKVLSTQRKILMDTISHRGFKLMIHLAPIIENNMVNRILFIITDVTPLEEMQRYIQQAEKMDAIGVLASSISHDFKNYLTIIDSYIDLIALELNSQSSTEYISLIKEVVDKSNSLIDNLLYLGKDMKRKTILLDVNSTLLALKSMIKPLLGNKIKLLFELATDINKVKFDPEQFSQVILNLVINAKDAIRENGLININTMNAENGINIEIKDNGIGIPQDMLSRIFEPFFSTKGEHDTGLGLATCFRIIQNHGGNIKVRSEIGKGTIFTLYIPDCTDKSI